MIWPSAHNKMEKLKEKIQFIIEDIIPTGCFFDAHSIIEYLIQHHSDIYLSSYQKDWTTEYYHSMISKTIDNFDGTIIKREVLSWSLNIHKRFTTNACWLKKQ